MRDTEIQRAVRACRGAFVAIAAFSLCINLLALASPIYMMQLYDRVLASRSIDTLVMLTLIVVVALAVLSLLDAVRRFILARIAAWFDERVRPDVLRAALEAVLRLDGARAGLAARDLAMLRGFLSGPGVMPLMDAPWTPIFLAALFVLHPLLGAIGLGAAVLLFALAILNEIVTKAPSRHAGAVAVRHQQWMESLLRNAEVIRAMGMLDGIMAAWTRHGDEAKEAQGIAADRGTVILTISKFSRLTIQTLVMATGAWLVIEENASPGVIFAGSFLLSRSLAPVENAIGTWKSVISSRLAYRRLVDLLALAPPAVPRTTLPPPEGRLVVERLTFVPPGAESPTLRGVSFDLDPGDVLGIIGPSAAGKSTLARLVAGTWSTGAGHVRLDGADIAIWHDAGGSRHIGYLPQDIELFAGTVRENIARFGDADPAMVIEAAQLVGLHETIMRLPRGYDSEIGEGGLRLSGGQRQRVGLARAVFGKPRVVILDEPDASLDQAGGEALHRTIGHLKAAGATVLVVTHRSSILNVADKLLLLRDGAVDAFGSRSEIVARLNAAHRAAAQNAAVLPQKQPA